MAILAPRRRTRPTSRRASRASSSATTESRRARHRRRPRRARRRWPRCCATRSAPTSSRPARAALPSSTAGPFANIAHGCNSALATRMALAPRRLRDHRGGLRLRSRRREVPRHQVPRARRVAAHAVVLVATLRALKFHGGVPAKETAKPAPAALEAVDLEHLDKHHVSSARARGLPVVVAINRFPTDTDEEIASVQRALDRSGVRAVACDAFARGGEGCARSRATPSPRRSSAPTQARRRRASRTSSTTRCQPRSSKVAKAFYGADGVVLTNKAQKDIERIGGPGGVAARVRGQDAAFAHGRPRAARPTEGLHGDGTRGTPSGGRRLRRALTGDLMTMPGCPRSRPRGVWWCTPTGP
jgi:formate--tetrahydrofolate ligase